MLTRASPPPPDDRICSPPFMELTSLGGDDTMRLLEENGLAFPFSAYRALSVPRGGRVGLKLPEGAGRPRPPGRAWPRVPGFLGGEGLARRRPSSSPVGRCWPWSSPRCPPAPTCPSPEGLRELSSFSLYLQGWALGVNNLANPSVFLSPTHSLQNQSGSWHQLSRGEWEV